MLREVFRSVPIPYMTASEYKAAGGGYDFGGVHYPYGKLPYIESFALWNGMLVDTRYQSPESQASMIYVFGAVNTAYWPSWDAAYWVFDGYTGKFFRRVHQQGNIGTVVFSMNNIEMSRKGVLWARHYYQMSLSTITLGTTATASFGDESKPVVEDPGGWTVLEYEKLLNTFFKDPRYQSGHLNGFDAWAIDEKRDVFINGTGTGFTVYMLSTGAYKYTIEFPASIVKVCLEDNDHCYILMSGNTLILFDYVRGEVLGSSRVPSLLALDDYWNTIPIEMAWDSVYRRLLVCEKTPDNPDGSCSMFIRGFQMIPEPTRITTPIPLRVPRQGRTIPVMVRVVGDRNEGIGEFAIDAKITGGGTQVGLPIGDNAGNAFIQVAVNPPADPYGYGGSSPSTGTSDMQITVKASVKVHKPDLPVTGVPGVTPGGGTPAPPVDQPPAEGGNLPATAPNMMDVLISVYNRQLWRLGPGFEQEPDGAGAFTSAAVVAMHDQDARFGHIRKNPGQSQYQGHAIDACCFKCDDGTTVEIYDFIAGTFESSRPGGGYLVWQFMSRNSEYAGLWQYP